jgi:hypothetical protein
MVLAILVGVQNYSYYKFKCITLKKVRQFQAFPQFVHSVNLTRETPSLSINEPASCSYHAGFQFY